MSKYIDAEKLKAEINRLKGLLNSPLCECLTKDYKAGGNKQLDLLFSFIDSLQQEQPSLPDNLDEAAEEHINKALFKWSYDDEDGIEQYVSDAFKAGAEWMAKQMIGKI